MYISELRQRLNETKDINRQGELLYEYSHETWENNFRLKANTAERLYKCTAWIWYDIADSIIWLRSYKTIVGCYDFQTNTLFQFGRYSMTTYQHFSKLRKYIRENFLDIPYCMHEFNCEIENWF